MAQSYSSAQPGYGLGYGLSAADREVEDLYAAITGRRAFSYDPGSDPLYHSYEDRYVQNGRMAMRDAMGQAAALTGGYGSSYAQSVGQQQYDEYLRSLSEVLPELYDLAYRQYSDQGAALQNAYDMAADRQQTAYQRRRDAESDRRYREQQAAAAAQQSYKQQQTAYGNLVKLISGSGYQPSDAELKAAGLTRAQAEALRQEYLRARGLLPASGGGGSGGGGGGGTRKTSADTGGRTGKATANGVTGANAKQTVSGSGGKTGGGTAVTGSTAGRSPGGRIVL